MVEWHFGECLRVACISCQGSLGVLITTLLLPVWRERLRLKSSVTQVSLGRSWLQPAVRQHHAGLSRMECPAPMNVGAKQEGS